METSPERYVETFMAQLIARNPNEPEYNRQNDLRRSSEPDATFRGLK